MNFTVNYILYKSPAGLNCETNIDDCLTSPCLNDGVCVDGVDMFSCNCTDDWMGATCDQVIITFVDLFLVFHENCVGFVKRRSVIFYMHKYAARRVSVTTAGSLCFVTTRPTTPARSCRVRTTPRVARNRRHMTTRASASVASRHPTVTSTLTTVLIMRALTMKRALMA